MPGQDRLSIPVLIERAQEASDLGVPMIAIFPVVEPERNYHIYALQNVRAGEIADVLGHRTLEMVKRYSHVADEHRRGVVERMNELISDEGA